MANYKSVGWDMYDPRMTIKATVNADVVKVYKGYACQINSSGEIIVDLSGDDRVHGLALTDANPGDKLVIVTHGRLKTVHAQDTIGDIAYGGTDADGCTPDTILTGTPCGWAIEEYLLFIHIDNLSAAE